MQISVCDVLLSVFWWSPYRCGPIMGSRVFHRVFSCIVVPSKWGRLLICSNSFPSFNKRLKTRYFWGWHHTYMALEHDCVYLPWRSRVKEFSSKFRFIGSACLLCFESRLINHCTQTNTDEDTDSQTDTEIHSGGDGMRTLIHLGFEPDICGPLWQATFFLMGPSSIHSAPVKP